MRFSMKLTVFWIRILLKPMTLRQKVNISITIDKQMLRNSFDSNDSNEQCFYRKFINC